MGLEVQWTCIIIPPAASAHSVPCISLHCAIYYDRWASSVIDMFTASVWWVKTKFRKIHQINLNNSRNGLHIITSQYRQCRYIVATVWKLSHILAGNAILADESSIGLFTAWKKSWHFLHPVTTREYNPFKWKLSQRHATSAQRNTSPKMRFCWILSDPQVQSGNSQDDISSRWYSCIINSFVLLFVLGSRGDSLITRQKNSAINQLIHLFPAEIQIYQVVTQTADKYHHSGTWLANLQLQHLLGNKIIIGFLNFLIITFFYNFSLRRDWGNVIQVRK